MTDASKSQPHVPTQDQALLETADRVYRYMISEHSGLTADLRSTVDANPAAWGLTIDDWQWNPGVGVTAISAYYDAVRRPDILDYLVHWVERNKAKAGKFQHVNFMAPFAIFPDMYRRTNNRYYLDTALDYADWIVKNSARTLTGAFQHGGDLTEEIWADTIFMVVLFLARLAGLVGDRALAEEASRQLQLHMQFLQDPETGVLFHGYDCQARNHKSGARWTRGNAWITLATPLILSEISPLIAIPPSVAAAYRRMVDGLVSFQAANGLWHTVMDRPNQYQESSGSAGIACGILKSIRSGLLPASYQPAAEKTLHGLLNKIKPDGEVAGVSGGTPILKTIDEYGHLSRYPTLYGQGLTLMLLAEYLSGFAGAR
jgi:unsaturated rhamnogalacturonyl hydrolase